MTEAQKARLELFVAFANEESKAKSQRALRGWETRRMKAILENPTSEFLGHKFSAIKKRRLTLGLTQNQVAERAHIALRHYQAFESGERDIMNGRFFTVCRVMDALEMDISDFYHENELAE